MLSRRIQVQNRKAKRPLRFLKPIFGFSLLAMALGACSTAPTNSTDNTALETLGSTNSEIENSNESVSGDLLSGDASNAVAASGSISDSTGNKIDAFFGKRRAPQIVAKPFEAEGRWINSYYFVRSNSETWESLSSLIYGRNDRASLLMSWNRNLGDSPKTGQVVYYNSALRPDDSEQMKVFSEDFGFSFDQVTVQPGDSLSLIGLNMYGDAQTWREIASLNPQIANPDLIEPGQVLKIQQKDFNTKAVFDQLLAQLQSNESPAPGEQKDQSEQSAQVTQLAQNTTSDTSESSNLVEAQSQDALQAPGQTNEENNWMTKLGISIILISLVALVIRKRAQSKKALSQSWDNQASVMTKISNQ